MSPAVRAFLRDAAYMVASALLAGFGAKFVAVGVTHMTADDWKAAIDVSVSALVAGLAVKGVTPWGAWGINVKPAVPALPTLPAGPGQPAP